MNRHVAHARLTTQVKNSPGVADVMRIYSQFIKTEAAHSLFDEVAAPVEVADSTDSISHR